MGSAVLDVLLVMMCFVVPLFIAPLFAGFVANRIYNKLREAEKGTEASEVKYVGGSSSGVLGLLERVGMRVALWLRRRGVPLSWACRIYGILLCIVICLLLNLVLLSVSFIVAISSI